MITWTFANLAFVPTVVRVLYALGVPVKAWLETKNTIAIALIDFSYAPVVFGLILLLYVPYVRRRGQSLRSLVGLERGPRFKDVLYGVPSYVGYFFLSLALALVATTFVPAINLQEVQNLGINQPTSLIEYVMVFVMLVIVPPLLEELLFRGFLLGTLLRGFAWPVAAVVTSLLFGVAHGQVNLFLDTFALSLVLCYLRYKTGSLWAGVILHALKNLIAFVLLYVVGAK